MEESIQAARRLHGKLKQMIRIDTERRIKSTYGAILRDENKVYVLGNKQVHLLNSDHREDFFEVVDAKLHLQSDYIRKDMRPYVEHETLKEFSQEIAKQLTSLLTVTLPPEHVAMAKVTKLKEGFLITFGKKQ